MNNLFFPGSLALLAFLCAACTGGSGGAGEGGGGSAGTGSTTSVSVGGTGGAGTATSEEEVTCDGFSHPGDTKHYDCMYSYGGYTCVCGEDGAWYQAFSNGVACQPPSCVPTCHYAGKTYAIGESFPAEDSCNTCTCTNGGSQGVAECTDIACNPVCEGLSDAPSTDSLSIIVHNETGQTVYVLASNCADSGSGVLVSSTTPGDGVVYDEPDPCQPTCHDQAHGPAACSCETRLDTMAPGAIQEDLFWFKRGRAATSMPAECWQSPAAGGELTCARAVDAPAGSYQLSVVAYSDCTGCQAGKIVPATPGGKRGVSVPVTFAIPMNQNHVDVVLGPDTFAN